MDSKRPQTAAIRPAKIGQPLGALAKCRAGGYRLLYERPIAVLFVLLLISIAVIIWHTNRTQSSLVEAEALRSAEQLSNALTEFRTIYTSEVVERVRKQGITVTHDYEDREGAIPLPATMSLMLGKKIGAIGAHESSIQSRLYSPFPFPWRRADGGLTDDFAEDAWEFLTKKPNTPFYRIEELGGVPVLRYATADLMRPACVDCHNTHPDSPKTDWKIGELRGVLEIISPLGIPFAESRSNLIETALLMLLMTMTGLLIVGVVLGNLRRVAAEARDLTNQTIEANTELHREATARKLAQAQVFQSSKLATLGEMTTSVAHELNQPLNIIRMAAGNIRRKISKGTPDPEYLDQKLKRIQDQTERAAAIIDHMRMFGRTAEGADEKLDPKKVITNVLDLIGEQLRLLGIEVVKEFPDECPSIKGNMIQMEQVVLSLLNNARDAIEDHDGEKKITLRVVEENGGIQIIAEDTGGGIPEDALPRIFEPFYTTKEMGKGTGLGLSVSYGIIRDMGGTIEAENIDGGAKFTITLPTA